MNFGNTLLIWHSIDVEEDFLPNFIKEKIAEELQVSVGDMDYKDITIPYVSVPEEIGFELVWDGEYEGLVRIIFGSLGGNYIRIESQNSWDAVTIHQLISDWFSELYKEE